MRNADMTFLDNPKISCFLAMLLALASSLQAREEVVEEIEIGRVPAGFRVGFSLLTTPERQYVAYYDQDRNMTVASRRVNAKEWDTKVLPTKIGWDSHNYVTMALDGDGHLHVSGNMHAVPLIYFRTEKAGHISSLKAAPMTGELENRMTYPHFITNPDGELLFNYRHGGSGNGFRLWNRYDTKTRKWSRLLETPLLDGKGKCNAYPILPRKHGDWFHMMWVWRDTPDCSTNHHLSYARSRDLVNWESAFGDKMELPLTLDRPELWVDPSPSGSGMINGGQRLHFDDEGRPIIVYHRNDKAGNMQIHAARPEDGKWVIHTLTDWDKPVPFGGRGSMPFIGIRLAELQEVKDGVLAVGYRHKDYGPGSLQFDEKSLKPVVKPIKVGAPWPKEVRRKRGDFPGLTVRHAGDLGSSGEKGVRYLLTWESLGSNHDRPRKPPLPEPSMLRLYKLREVAK